MGDADSTFTVAIKTTGDPAGITAVNTALRTTSTLTQEAAQAGQTLAVAHQTAGAAAEGHAHSNSTLRLATRGANDAAWAITDLMQGNFVVAMHRGRGAVEDLGIAVKSALFPTAVIAGLTIGVELLSHLVFSTDEATKATEKLGKEEDQTTKKVFDFNEALKEQTIHAEEAVTPQVAYTQALKDFRVQLDSVHVGADQLKTTFDAIDKINKQIAEAAAARKKQIEDEIKSQNSLIDAELNLAKAIINRRRASGEIFGDDATRQAAEADKKAQLAKMDNEHKAREDKDAEDRKAVAVKKDMADRATGQSDITRMDLTAARKEVEPLLQEARDLKLDTGKLETGEDFRKLADALLKRRQKIEAESGGGGQEDREIDDEDMAKLRRFSQLMDSAPSKEKVSRDQQAQAQAAEAEYRRGQPIRDRQMQEEAAKRQVVEEDYQGKIAELKRKQDKEQVEQRKKDLEQFLKDNPQSADDAHAAALDLANHRRREDQRSPEEQARNLLFQQRQAATTQGAAVDQALVRFGAPNAAVAAGQSAYDSRAAQQSAFGGLPAQQQIMAEAKSAIAGAGGVDNSTATGSAAANVQEALRLANKDPNVANMQRILTMTQALIEAQRAQHADASNAEAQLRKMEQQIADLQGALKHTSR